MAAYIFLFIYLFLSGQQVLVYKAEAIQNIPSISMSPPQIWRL